MSETTSSKHPLKHGQDLVLASKALDGDPEAVARIQTEFQPMLERVMMSKGLANSDAVELVADIIAECFGAGKKGQTVPLLEKFEARSSLSTWLIRITWNRWLDLKRRDKFKGTLPSYDGDEELANGAFDRVPDEAEEVIDGDLSSLMGAAIKAAFAALDAESHLMLKLSFLHGLSQAKIAEMWSCDQTRISRMLTAAREAVAAETMRALKQADPTLELQWDDFLQLCAAGIEV